MNRDNINLKGMDYMFKKAYTEEAVKEAASKYAMDVFGKKFDDEITVYRVTPRTMFSKFDYILMNSKNMPGSTITLRRGSKEDVSCDYMEVYYREMHIRPMVEDYFKNLWGDICIIFNCADHAYGPVNPNLTLDEFMKKTGVSFDILVKEEDFEKSGKDLYEKEVLRFMEEAKEKGWKYNRITIGVYDNIPSEKVNGTEQFKMKWEDTCKQLEYADFFLSENGLIEHKEWTLTAK